MKKAHEVELENERAKYRDLMSKMSANAGMESFHKKHESVQILSVIVEFNVKLVHILQSRNSRVELLLVCYDTDM
jgi:hypothetical protein